MTRGGSKGLIGKRVGPRSGDEGRTDVGGLMRFHLDSSIKRAAVGIEIKQQIKKEKNRPFSNNTLYYFKDQARWGINEL